MKRFLFKGKLIISALLISTLLMPMLPMVALATSISAASLADLSAYATEAGGVTTYTIPEGTTVEVTSTFDISGGSYVFTGGGTLLLKLDTNCNPMFHISGGALTFDNIILDGNSGNGYLVSDPGHVVQSGGAIHITGGSFIMNGGIIRNCKGFYQGAAVYLTSPGGNFIMNGGLITGNRTGDAGDPTTAYPGHYGAIYHGRGNVTLTGGTITDNGDLPVYYYQSGFSITPKADITIDGTIYSFKKNIKLLITPVEGYPVSSVTLGGSTLTPAADGSYSIAPTASDTDANAKYIIGGLSIVVGNTEAPPVLTADSSDATIGQAIDITFTDDAAWRAAVTGVKVGDTTVQDYTLTEGMLTIPASYFTEAESYTITVSATGYSDATVSQVITAAASDTIAPTLTEGNIERTSDSAATVKFTSDEEGTYYYSVVDQGDDEPAIDTTGSGTACGATETTIPLTGLTAGAKDIYIVVKDAAGNISSPATKITIPAYVAPTQLTAPTLSGTPAGKTSTSVTLAAPPASTEDTAATLQYRSKLTSAGNWGAWQANAAFTGLTANTSYDFQARYKAVTTTDWSDSGPGNTVAIVTDTAAAYSVSVADGITNGVVTTSVSSASVGENIVINATPEDGYYVQSAQYSIDGGATWSSLSGGSGRYRVGMKAADLLVRAAFSPYTVLEISSLTELTAFRDAVNSGNTHAGYLVRLTADIDLTGEWTPIGSDSAHSFSGIFDGGGHTVSGLSITNAAGSCAGFFGRTNGATIENLTVRGSIQVSGKSAVGGIAGYGDATRFTSCSSYVSIVNTGSTYTGGIVGNDVFYGAVIKDCANYASVAGGDHAGGILGASNSSMIKPEILRCGNYAAVSATAYAGGIAASYNGATLTGCVNKGSVASSMATAGILASCSGVQITDCYNTGAISGYGTSTLRQNEPYVAGIFSGYTSGDGIILMNCYNTGALSKTGTFTSTVTRYGEIAPTMTIGGNSYSGFTEVPVPESTCRQVNCYTSAELTALEDAVAALGGSFKADTNGVNANNTPLLTWESGEADDTEYQVSFAITGPAEFNVKVYTDSGKTTLAEANQDGSYSLMTGQYPYLVTANGYATAFGTLQVVHSDVSVPVTMQPGSPITFTVSPDSASLSVAYNGVGVPADSVTGGSYSYTLVKGATYTYTATADGYNGISKSYTVPETSDSVTVTLTPSGQNPNNPTVTGGQTISAGGVYNLGRNDGASQGVITISTTDPVTLIGTGVSLADIYENLYLDCMVEGVNLTLQDLYISNTVGTTNMIDFMGAGNYLYFAGTDILDVDTGATGNAMIHAGRDVELTVGGVTPDDTLYFYKSEQGAGIGGNQGEYNGKITITGGNFFMKNTKQGALIGSGANASAAPGSPGDIIIEGGILNLIPISRGAAIGGSAGSAGGATGTTVYIQGGAITINVDYSGSAIGGGGFAEGNDSDGGILYYSGGSIRTFIDYNAVDPNGDGVVSNNDNLWKDFGVTTYGVNDAAITADKRNADGEKNVYLLTFDTNRLSSPSDSYTVEEGGAVIYSGGRHAWRYINEDLYKMDQIPVNYTIDNWAPLEDPNLYLYLTGEDHTLIVNGEEFDISWDSETSTFSFGDGTETPATPSISTQPAGATYTVDDTAAALSVTASTTDGGTLSYQWYSSADNTATTPSDDTAVGTDNASYTPTTTAAGTTYYYCVVTNTLDGQTSTATSDVVAVVVEAEGPGVLTPPLLTADATDNTVGQAVNITFPADAAWEAAISGITVNTASLDGEQYMVNPGSINIDSGVFTTAGDYSIAVTATGYSDATVIQTIYGAAPGGYTVTFVSDGATYTTVSAASGEAIEAPAAPAKESHVFGGWYTDETWTTAVGFPYTVTGDVTFYARWTAAPEDSPRYTVTPTADQSVYEVGESGGISTMTVKEGAAGLKYFGTQVAPVIEHEGREAVVFVHLRNGTQLSINVTRADFDLLDEAQAGFNVQAGDVVRVFIVDDLTNDVNFNPTVLQ